MDRKTNRRINWDALGIATSFACAIHCAILPLVLTSLPILGVNILENAGFEYFMIALAFGIGSGSLWHGYRKHHRQWRPWLFFSVGVLFLLAKQVWRSYELWLLPFAAVFIISAHLLNYRACARHRPAGTPGKTGENDPGLQMYPKR
ncbi:MAG: MerC domain-containing protein [Puia sp.]|nr:MerC domain-containing protein [Puia sp.]